MAVTPVRRIVDGSNGGVCFLVYVVLADSVMNSFEIIALHRAHPDTRQTG
jgi:hypothetical protein